MAVSEFISHHDDDSCHMDVGMCSHPITWGEKMLYPYLIVVSFFIFF